MTDTAKSTADRIRDAAVANHRALTEARGESPADALADGLPRLAWTDAMQEKAALALRNGAPADAPRDRRGIDDWATSRHESRFQFERYRFIILSQLAAGYQNTGEEVYARAARDYIEEHLNTYSTPPYDDTLNLSIRLCQHGRQGWIGTLPHFLGSDAYDDAFVDRVVAATREQVAYLKERYPRHGNTRLFGINCTLWCGLCLPFLPEAEGWRTLGARLFNDAFHREINPDGSNLERDPHYLGMYVQNFSESLIWARAFPDLGLRVSVEPVARMWDFAACSRKPSGHECGLHDGTTDWQGRAGGTQDGAVDRNGAAPCDIFRRRMAFRRLHGLPETPPPASAFFPDAGQVFARTGWDEDAGYMVFDASCWGGAHSHLSRNSIQLHWAGRTLLTDPGTLTYRMGHAGGNEQDNQAGPYGKSTPAHSTVNLNGWNQWTVNPDFTRHWAAPGYDAVVSRYSGGYWPGRYGWWFFEGGGDGLAAVHDRVLFWIHDRAAVVIDSIMRWQEPLAGPDHQAPRLETVWQFPPYRLAVDADARRAQTCNDDVNLLLLFPRVAQGTTFTVREGETDPMRGWIGSPDRGHTYLPAPQLVLESRPWPDFMETTVTVLVPFRGADAPAVTAAVDFAEAANPHAAPRPLGLTLQWADGATDRVFWTPALDTMIGACDGAETDASLLCLRTAADGTTGGCFCNGTYAHPAPGQALERPGAAAW